MAKDRFLIAPIKQGLRGDMKSWQIPEDSFERLENAFIDKGCVVKRFGSRYTGTGAAAGFESLRSRLRIALKTNGTTDGAGAAAGTVPGGGNGNPGQMFSIGDAYYTVAATGAMIPFNNTSTTHTFNITTGAFVFDAAAAMTQIYFYPAEPVMGLFNYETGNIHNRPVIASDTRLIYQYNGTSWNAIGPVTAGAYVPFTGTNSDFFHMTNWMGSQFYNTFLFVTNFVTADGMWYYDGATWTNFRPKFLVAGTDVQNIVLTARIILPFKDRLILLNTVENDAAGNTRSYQNRCRFCRNGTPTTAPGSVAWLEKNEVGYEGAGWIEAPTEEEIISAEFIKDRLVVFFERSTWELAYTGSQTQPFIWQKINTELGSESPRSSVPFDKAILTVGTTGIHACNSANVERIDNEIPDEIFKIRNTDAGPFRVAGIRDYIKEVVYWTVPYISDSEDSEIFPNKVLVYNYKEGTWSTNDDSVTAFGHLEQQIGPTWATLYDKWLEATYTWEDGIIAPQPITVIAGNQEGYVFVLDPAFPSNASVLQISNAVFALGLVTLTIVNHNLKDGDFIKIENCQGSVELNGNIFEVTTAGVNTITILAAAMTAYTGLGTASRISRIDILTKQFNPYLKQGQNISVDLIEFAVQRTTAGVLNVQYFSSTSGLDLVNEGNASGSTLGSYVLECFPYNINPLEAVQRLLWHPVYFQSSGEFIQIRLFTSDESMIISDTVEEGFCLEGMMLHTSPVGRRLQ